MRNPLRRQTSLNHAKMKPEDIGNIRLREQLLEAQRITSEQARLTLMMMENENKAFRENMLKRYKLRKGKQFMFNLQHGYIHRPKSKPWEKPTKPKVKEIIEPKASQNGESNLPEGTIGAIKKLNESIIEGNHVHGPDCGHSTGYYPEIEKSNEEVEGAPA